MNKIIFSILLLLVSISIDANNETTTPKDKLYAVIDSCDRSEVELTDVRKKQIIMLARNIQEDKAAIDFFMKNELYGSAYHSKMQKSLSDNKLDSVYHYYKESIINYDKYEKEDSKTLVPSMQCNLVYWAVNNGYYEIAIKTVNNMKQFVLKNGLTDDLLWTYQLLSMVYQMMDRPAESIEVAKEGLALNIDQPKTPLAFSIKSALYQQQIQSYTALKKYDESLFYCNELEQWIDKMPAYGYMDLNLKDYQDVSYYIIYLWSSMNYFGLNNNAEAIAMFDKAKATFEDLKKGRFYNEDILYSLNSGYVEFYYHTGNYELAIDYSEKAMSYLTEMQRYPEYLKEKIFLSDIYTKFGNLQKSNDLRKEALLLSDSINTASLVKDINSLWTIFEVDKAKFEKKQSESEKAKLYIIVVAVSIVVVLCVGFILILIRKNKILKSKNHKLYEQQKTENIFLEKKDLTKESSEVELSLYDRLVQYITKSEQYLNADISRESVAKELGTNRQYITEAIQKNAGMSFPEFINNFRLQYACTLLRNKKEVRIKEVYLDSGFSNRTTFARLFKDKYGMTPSEYKECAENDK